MSEWTRVSRRRLCPVCGRGDWCLVAGPEGDPTAAICARIESAKLVGDAGWLHILRKDGDAWKPPRLRSVAIKPAPEPRVDIVTLARQYRLAMTDRRRVELADLLGVSPASLKRLGVGWCEMGRWYSFPMIGMICDGGTVVGIRLRGADGRKLSIRGGCEGLFIPAEIYGGLRRLLILEGPSDTAAALTLGFDAVGRPSCVGGVSLLVDLVAKLKPGQVVIVADGDGPGRRGAETLASKLVPLARDLKVIEPPEGVKDMRVWVQAGAAAADVIQVIDAAPIRMMTVCSRRKGARNG